jgi:transglutaminase-like putative cysteine protease
LGAEVQWYPGTATVIASKGKTNIELTAWGPVLKNGIAMEIDVPPRIVRGRMMVPLRFVSEAMGAYVDWNPAIKRVTIIGGGSGDAPTGSVTGRNRSILYTWEYEGNSFTFGPLEIPEEEYNTILEFYRSKPHPSLVNLYYRSSTYTYSYDEDGEAILTTLVERLKEAAEEENITGDEVVEFVIAFVQGFPYVSDSLSTPYDDYTRYPIETLLEREGDCEDTALLTAVLLKELGYGSALILMRQEGHAAVGVLGGDGVYGTYYEVKGKKYFYVETTAKGWPIGKVPEEMEGAKALVVPL